MNKEWLALPCPGLRWLPVWRRNFLVWRKLAIPSILGNLADPLLYMLGLGYGLGSLLPTLDGIDYPRFLAAGTIIASTMHAATFEALYSAFSRMQMQKTWEAILNTPLSLDEVVTGELVWAASKSLLAGSAILLVVSGLGLASWPHAVWLVPLIFLTGLAFAALGLIVCALAPSYDFFMYYFTLFITPMLMLSGVFFPNEQLPAPLQAAAGLLPLTHAIAIGRPLLLGEWPTSIALHLCALGMMAAICYYGACVLTRRRLL